MASTALLVMDVQDAVVHRYPDEEYLPRLRTVLDGARAAAIPVVHVVVGFRTGFPEVHPRNRMFGAMAGRAGVTAPPAEPHAALGALADEPVVTKRRVSAFSGSDLDVLLRSRGVDHLVLTGIATSGVVLSTLRQAADLDYGLTVVADGCLDADPEVHRVLTEKVFPAQADVTTAAAWLAATAG